MMAADNDDAYNLSPPFILETVAAARDFVEQRGVTLPPLQVTVGRAYSCVVGVANRAS